MEKKDSKFKPGVSGNPLGRPAGCGNSPLEARTIILRVFERYKAEFEDAIDQMARADIVLYYSRFVVPFMPKEVVFNDVTPSRIKERKEIIIELEALEVKLSEKNSSGANCAQ